MLPNSYAGEGLVVFVHKEGIGAGVVSSVDKSGSSFGWGGERGGGRDGAGEGGSGREEGEIGVDGDDDGRVADCDDAVAAGGVDDCAVWVWVLSDGGVLLWFAKPSSVAWRALGAEEICDRGGWVGTRLPVAFGGRAACVQSSSVGKYGMEFSGVLSLSSVQRRRNSGHFLLELGWSVVLQLTQIWGFSDGHAEVL